MKQQALWVAMLLMALSVSFASNDEAIAVAETAAYSWLALTDGEDYIGSWENASSSSQAAVTHEEWEQALSAARGLFGDLKSREMESADFYTTLPGAPDGEYVVLQFNSSFDQKASAVETVTVMLDRDGSWRVSGYFIK